MVDNEPAPTHEVKRFKIGWRHPLRTTLVLLAAGVGSAALLPVPAQASVCEFVQGFKVLHSQIPNQVGDCVTNQYAVGLNEVDQQTRGGLMVWDKTDGFSKFTNGSITWIDGPKGLVTRPNDRRFSWEADFTSLNSVDIKSQASSSHSSSTLPGSSGAITTSQISGSNNSESSNDRTGWVVGGIAGVLLTIGGVRVLLEDFGRRSRRESDYRHNDTGGNGIDM